MYDIYVKEKTTNYRPYADLNSGLGLINYMSSSCTFSDILDQIVDIPHR